MGACSDTNQDCAIRLSRGEDCQFSAYMQAACAKTCNRCGSGTTVQNGQFTQGGQLLGGQDQNGAQLPVGQVTGGCVDRDPTCAIWANQGQCEMVKTLCPSCCATPSAAPTTATASPITPEMVAAAVKAEITLDIEIADFDGAQQRAFGEELAGRYKVSKDRIQITNVQAASVQMDVIILGGRAGSGEPSPEQVMSGLLTDVQSGVWLGNFKILQVLADTAAPTAEARPLVPVAASQSTPAPLSPAVPGSASTPAPLSPEVPALTKSPTDTGMMGAEVLATARPTATPVATPTPSAGQISAPAEIPDQKIEGTGQTGGLSGSSPAPPPPPANAAAPYTFNVCLTVAVLMVTVRESL